MLLCCDLQNRQKYSTVKMAPLNKFSIHSSFLFFFFFFFFYYCWCLAAVLCDWLKTCVKSFHRCQDKGCYWLVLQHHSTPTNYPHPNAVVWSGQADVCIRWGCTPEEEEEEEEEEEGEGEEALGAIPGNGAPEWGQWSKWMLFTTLDIDQGCSGGEAHLCLDFAVFTQRDTFKSSQQVASKMLTRSYEDKVFKKQLFSSGLH